MIKDDTYNKTKYHLECMLSKKGDKSAEELFRTFFNGVLIPEFEESYGVKIKYSKNYKGLISKLEGIRETLVYKDHKKLNINRIYYHLILYKTTLIDYNRSIVTL